jgi:hypothetical protein
MSVVASDIVIYASVNMPTGDTGAAGGDINSGVRVVFDDIVPTSLVEVVSDSGNDTQNVTIVGRDSAGLIQTDTFALSGTTAVSGAQLFERILTATLDGVATGSITFRETVTNTGIAVIYPTESGFRRPFYNAIANPAGGADKTLYEKVCIKNNNETNALLTATVTEISSGLYNIVQFGLEPTLQATESVADRTTAPTGVTYYGAAASGVAGGDLSSLSWQGTWLQLTLTAGTAAQNSYYQLRVQGATT